MAEHTQQSTDQHAKKCKSFHHPYDVHFRNFTSKMTTRVVLHVPGSDSSALCSLCEKAGYLCETSSSPEHTLSLLQDVIFQNILVVSVHNSLDQVALSLLRSIQTKDLRFSTAIIALVIPSSSESQLSLQKESPLLLDTLIQHGVSRIIHHTEVEHRLVTELKLAEKSELHNNNNGLFSRALLEAVENCHDAVQITGKDSCILYVNKAFVDLNGFSHEECIGKPALSVLQLENWGSTWLQDNGTTSLLDRKERWEGACVARRRSGSAIKHYFKLLPITTTSSQLTHYVMIQRLLSPHEHIISPSQRHNSVTDAAFPLVKKSSSGTFPRMSTLSEAPLVKAVAMIAAAREDPACSIEMRESLEKCMEYLRFEELYTPFTHLPSGRNTGIVEGLLYPTRRFSLASEYQRGIVHTPSHAIRHQPYDIPPAIKECVSNLSSWDFNILKLETTSNYEPLYYLGMEIFDEFEVADTLDIDLTVVASWLKMMERNYHRTNAYHNSTHAADVLQATAYLIRIFQANYGPEHPDHMEPLEIAALLITAVIHDLDHPGRTNPFLYNTSNEKSILYNDRAVLENHHVAFSFKLTLQSRQVNLYQSLPRATYQSIRSSIIDLVLATDMSKHFEHLSKFNTTFVPLQSRPFPPIGGARPPTSPVEPPVGGANPPVPGIQTPVGGANPSVSGDQSLGTTEDSASSLVIIPNIGSTSSLAVSRDGREGREGRILAKRILVKCADIVNACRPRELCIAWAGRISEEYFAQTEEEKRSNLPVVFPDFDRLTCKLPSTQIKFIEFFVHELFHAWNCYCNIDELITNMDDNYNYWLVLTGPSSDSEGEQDTTTRENVVGRKQQTTEITKK